jgi:hypothetical protein
VATGQETKRIGPKETEKIEEEEEKENRARDLSGS